MSRRELVSSALEKLSVFLTPYLPVLNAHMVHFITGDEWDKLNSQLREDLLILDECQLSELPNNFLNIKSQELPHIRPALRKLMEDVSGHSLSSLNVSNDLQSIWQQLEVEPLSSMINFDRFMKVKKTHEVGALCDIIASLAKYSHCELILDLGCGKGALGSMISLNHDGLYVWGIDAAGFNSHVEEGRKMKMEKSFNADLKKKRSESTDEQAIKKSLKFHRTTQFLSQDLNCQTVIDECRAHFRKPFQQHLGLVGLHTCGNLASTSIALFVNSPAARFLCNVGCCYHLLDEAYETESSQIEAGFPMSQSLKSKRFALGRNVRMVAAQPLERYAYQKTLQMDVLFYRALLQVVLRDKLNSFNAREFQVGRLRKPVLDFNQYVRWAFGKLHLELEISDEELNNYFTSYKDQLKKMKAFFQLRLILAPLVESVILLDRLAFLLEQEKVRDAFLVRIFSPVTSPRCYALMAFNKEN